MSTKLKTTVTALTQAQLIDVKKRVARVVSLVKRSATAWLDVTKEFADAKKAFGKNKLAFERFHNDAGFTHPVANKLTLVGECKPLHTAKYEPVTCRTDGWSTLYELTKVHQQNKLEQVLEYVIEHPDASVTRSVVQNLLSEKPATEKTIVLAKFVVPESAFKLLTNEELKTLNIALSQAGALLSTAATCVQFVPVENSVKNALGGIAPRTSAKLREAMQQASAQVLAQVLAHVRDSEIARLAPKALTALEQHEHNEAAWQFNILQHNARRREDASEVQELKSCKTPTAADEKKLARLEAQIAGSPIRKMPYDPSSEVSIENPTHRFSVSSQSTDAWSYDRFIAYIHENNILLPDDGIPDRPEYAEAWCASLGETALTGTPAEKRASKKALKDIEAGEKRAVASGNVSKAPIARAVQAQVNEATL